MQQTSDVLGVILVHGLWHGGWVWDAVRRDLDRAGVVSRVVELPMNDLASDIMVTRRALDEFDRPVVLVGHSYGGAVITGAGTHPHVAHLLYLAAYQLAEGESVGRTLPDLGVPPTRLADALRFSDDGKVVSLDPETGRGVAVRRRARADRGRRGGPTAAGGSSGLQRCA